MLESLLARDQESFSFEDVQRLLVLLGVVFVFHSVFEPERVMAQDRTKLAEVLEKKVLPNVIALIDGLDVEIRWDEKGQDVTRLFVMKDGKKVILQEIRVPRHVVKGRKSSKDWRDLRKNREKRTSLKMSQKKISKESVVQIELVWEGDGDAKKARKEVSEMVSVGQQTFESFKKGMKEDPEMIQDTFPLPSLTLRVKDGFTELAALQWFSSWGSFLVFKKVGKDFVLLSRVVCPYQEQTTYYGDPSVLSESDEVKVVAICDGKYQVMDMKTGKTK
ncbi:MAG: hypothetical protein P1V18_06010 [Candidatus Gracilibacteria bacterium]|nr:hypothetical protein [Candidatus Gracilibacteria bacterium]